MDINKIYPTISSGEVKIIKDLGVSGRRHKVIIKFLITGAERTVELGNLLKGKVKDNTNPNNILPNPLYITDEFILGRIQNIHSDMMGRCYNPNDSLYKAYGMIGVTVNERWHDINNFINDIKLLDQYYKFLQFPTVYQLDKDFKQCNIPKQFRKYSLETCMFLHRMDNLNLEAMERKKLGLTSSNYFGVIRDKNCFYMRIRDHTKTIQMYFTNEIAAANAYNYWATMIHNYDIIPLFNDVKYMDISEWIKYTSTRLNMITLIN